MENKQHDSLPEFDAKYIDQLFSTNNPVKKKATPKAAEPEKPKPSAPKTPKKPKPSTPKAPEKPIEPADTAVSAPGTRPINRVVILIAAVCLLVGFFLGRLTLPTPKPGLPTQPSPDGISTYPNNPDIAVDYASMSTEQLVNIAVRISELSSYGSPVSSTTLPSEVYRNLRLEHPVLAELEQRPDAITELHSKATTSAVSTEIYAANALASYYSRNQTDGPDIDPGISVTPAAACQWIQSEDEYVTIYEFTEAPKVTYRQVPGLLGSESRTQFDFDGAVFLLEGQETFSKGQPNFWFCVELKDNAYAVLSEYPQPRIARQDLLLGPNNDSWTSIRRYENGWFVYGYTSKAAELSFSFKPSNKVSLHGVTMTAFPDWESITTRVVAETALKCELFLVDLDALNPDRNITEYPLIVELLSREDGITQLLRLSAGRGITQLPYMFQHLMSEKEKEAMQILSAGAGYIDAVPLSGAPLVENEDGIVVDFLSGYYVRKTPIDLRSIPLSEMNCWIYVPLSNGGQLLWQSGWTLDAKLPNDDPIGVWDLYDSSNNQLTGWIVSGKLTEPETIWLQLTKAGPLLEKLDVKPVLLES